MASEKESHHFVAQLRVVHRLAIGITHSEKGVEQIATRLVRGAALMDDARDDVVQVADGVPSRWRQEIRKVKWEEECLARIGYEAVSHNLHSLADSLGDASDFCSKQ